MQSKIPDNKRPLPIIRVFVSSTFSDLKHERNALQAQVWRKLERYCQQRGFTFQAIDLRWGVPAEAGLDHRTMRICFEELRRSQETSPEPNFMILLGNRYGCRPLPEVISVEEFEKLKTAAEQIQKEPPDFTRKPTASQVELLAKSVPVLDDWYLLDQNAKPFGERSPIGEYILRSRKPLLNGVDYGRQSDGNGILRDTAAWVDVQFVLWSIVNRAFPATDLAGRFQALHETSPGTVPSSVRFQASATEQEIWPGALHAEGTGAKQHVIAWFREIENLGDYPPGPQLKDFVDLKDDGTPDQGSEQALEQLTTELKRNLDAKNVFTAKCRWNVEKQGRSVPDVTTDHLYKMCKLIRVRLQEMIILQINAYWGCDLSAHDATLAQVRGSQQELDLECADHLRFAAERAPEKAFVGRESELQRIRDYLHSETNQPFVVHGPSGSGKTALLGKIIQEVTPPRSADGPRRKTGPIVLTRFIGTTPESSNPRSLLSSLCRELRQEFELEAPLPTDLNELIDEFYSHLGKATASRSVFVFLDALDQLDAADRGRSVSWIRSPLLSTTDAACHTRMVVSCLSPSDEFPEDSEACEPFRDLKLRALLGNHELGALDENDARQLLARWLHGAGRSVSETQQEMIWSTMQKSSASRQPLFLKVLFEEAKLWRSYDAEVRLNKPAAANDYIGSLLKQLFDRLSLEVNHGQLLVERALGYIAAARRGLSETEILEVLFADAEFHQQLLQASQDNHHTLPTDPPRIPIALWSRLRSDLAPYLSERAAPGGNVLYFYQRQVADEVRIRFLNREDLASRRHQQLSRLFESFADPRRNQTWLGQNLRGFDELPYQLASARLHGELVSVLGDVAFSAAKATRNAVFDLLNDLNVASTLIDRSDIEVPRLHQVRQIVRREAERLSRYPECSLQQILLGIAALIEPDHGLWSQAKSLTESHFGSASLSSPSIYPNIQLVQTAAHAGKN